jgi:hypothetical protein
MTRYDRYLRMFKRTKAKVSIINQCPVLLRCELKFWYRGDVSSPKDASPHRNRRSMLVY